MNDLPQQLIEYAPWRHSLSPIWPLSQLYLRRNISHYPFPHRLKTHEKLLIHDAIKEAIHSTLEPSALHLSSAQISPLSKTLLSEQLFWSDRFYRLQDETSLSMPPSMQWQAFINAQNHLGLQRLSVNANLRSDLSLLLDLEKTLGQKLSFAFENQFGYLTAQMEHCGTGLSAQAFLHLPALIASGRLSEMLFNHLPEGISARTLGRNPKHPPGDLLIFFNTHSLGYSVHDLLHHLTKTAQIFEAQENACRVQLMQEPPDEWLGRITRAYGILTFSHQLSTRETLNHLSHLKLGAHLGWIQGISDGECNDLFFKMRRSHLPAASQAETNAKRALLLKKSLAHSTLTI